MKKLAAPTALDFSQKAIQKAVFNQVFQHPLSVYSSSLGVVGLLAALLLSPGPLLFSASLIVLGIGIGTTIVNYFFRSETLAHKYLNSLNKQLEGYNEELLVRLKQELTEYKSLQGVERYAKQGVEQFERVQKKLNNFKALLAEKFDSQELTYTRFLGAAEQVYFSALDNLQGITGALKTANNIDEDYIQERLRYLYALKKPEEADKKEIETLTQRKQLRKKQLEQVNSLLTLNEEAMTQIDQSMAAISTITTQTGRAVVDMDTAKEELERLIQRTKDY